MFEVLFAGVVTPGIAGDEDFHMVGLFKVQSIPRVGDDLELPGFLGITEGFTVTVSKVVWVMNPMNCIAYPRVFFEIVDHDCLSALSGWDTWIRDDNETELKKINERIDAIFETV